MKQTWQKNEKLATRRVLAALRKHWLQLPGEGRVIAAVSGGIDSMILLEGLSRLAARAEERARILVAHVNHGLRGAESDGDEALVLDRARSLGLAVQSSRLAWVGDRPSQARCRERRELVFAELAANPADQIWLAHHLNDQAETVFLRLLRGAGARGLRGMLPKNGRKVRPFLGLPKADLLAAAEGWGVVWREDRSNQDRAHYERNWVRGIFPLLEERRPGFQEKLAALAEEARGWPAAPALPLFSPEPGFAFWRPESVPGTRELAEGFALSRLRAGELRELLRRPSGSLHVEGARFRWSAGVLLREKGRSFSAGLQTVTGSPGRLRGALGSWLVPSEFELWREGHGPGEKRKKEFQEMRVPVFFREGIPLLRLDGRPRALLPERLAECANVQFEPSLLGSWWLETR